MRCAGLKGESIHTSHHQSDTAGQGQANAHGQHIGGCTELPGRNAEQMAPEPPPLHDGSDRHPACATGCPAIAAAGDGMQTCCLDACMHAYAA